MIATMIDALTITLAASGFVNLVFVVHILSMTSLPRRLGERRYHRTMALLTSALGAQVPDDAQQTSIISHVAVAKWDVGNVRLLLIQEWDYSTELRVFVRHTDPFLPDIGLRLLNGIASWPLNRLYLNEKKLIARIGRLLEEHADGQV